MYTTEIINGYDVSKDKDGNIIKSVTYYGQLFTKFCFNKLGKLNLVIENTIGHVKARLIINGTCNAFFLEVDINDNVKLNYE